MKRNFVTLKVDLDYIPPYTTLTEWIQTRLSILGRFFLCPREIYYRKSRGGKGYHIIFLIDAEMSDMQILTVQWLLGDDYKRCEYNEKRIRMGIADWNVLFESGEKWKKWTSKF